MGSLKNVYRVSSFLNCVNDSRPYVWIMSYTRWNALRATDGFSTTMSRYSQNVPSQCCSRKFETSSFLSTIETRGFVLTAGMWFISQVFAQPRVRGGGGDGGN